MSIKEFEFQFGEEPNDSSSSADTPAPAAEEASEREAQRSDPDGARADKGVSRSGEDAEPLPVEIDHGPLHKLVDSNFMQYASYVICSRAIPNVADGLKPVQRRIMHALYEKDDGRFVKVANVVGHTMQYHPHGDASINDALVSLTNRGGYLIEGQGNFGNIYTGDRAAAGRYIECRLTPLAREQLFNKELTRFISSYDGRNKEPVTLPSKLPLLLMLGADGIAVGLSTAILTYNIIELFEAQVEILREKKRTPYKADPMPDFQTGGIMDVSEYDNGRGKVKVRAEIEERKGRLVITGLPYGQTTEKVTASIEDAVKKKKVAVRVINDYTAEHVEIELVLSHGANPVQVEKALYAFTCCEISLPSRIIVIRDKRPVEMSVDEILHLNTVQLVGLLEGELKLRRDKLLDSFHTKTLVQIFVENRIYQAIEQCKTYEAVFAAVYKGLDPFKELLRRSIVDEDIEMLLAVRIKRISLFDIEKNRRDIDDILRELTEVEKNLAGLNGYSIRYVKDLIKRYKDTYPRRTKIATFKEIVVRDLTASELTMCHDPEIQFLGSAVKGDELFKCSSLDKLLFVWSSGRYQMVPPPEKLFVDQDFLYGAIFERDREMTCVYTHKGVSYVKRFTFGGTIMNRDYQLAPEGSKIIFFQEGCPENIYLRYRAAKNQRVHQQVFAIADLVAVKGAKAKGNRLTTKSVQYIDTKPGRWWRTNEAPLGGVSF